jgi:hypothetical protein
MPLRNIQRSAGGGGRPIERLRGSRRLCDSAGSLATTVSWKDRQGSYILQLSPAVLPALNNMITGVVTDDLSTACVGGKRGCSESIGARVGCRWVASIPLRVVRHNGRAATRHSARAERWLTATAQRESLAHAVDQVSE